LSKRDLDEDTIEKFNKIIRNLNLIGNICSNFSKLEKNKIKFLNDEFENLYNNFENHINSHIKSDAKLSTSSYSSSDEDNLFN
jgi:hypothetical protein